MITIRIKITTNNFAFYMVDINYELEYFIRKIMHYAEFEQKQIFD